MGIDDMLPKVLLQFGTFQMLHTKHVYFTFQCFSVVWHLTSPILHLCHFDIHCTFLYSSIFPH